MCHSDTNFTTVQFDNFKMVLREDLGEPRLFTSEECLSPSYLESLIQLMEGGYEVLKSVVAVSDIHMNLIINFWRIKYDIKEALEHAKNEGLKVPAGFHPCNCLYLEQDKVAKYLECQMPRFMIIKVKVDEGGQARVFQNSHNCTVEDLKAIMVLEA